MAAAMGNRAHRQPMIAKPRLDPDVRQLLVVLGPRYPVTNRGNAAIAAQRGQRPPPGRRFSLRPA